MPTAANAFFTSDCLVVGHYTAAVARAVAIKTIARFHILFFPPYHWVCVFMIIIAIKITNVILLLSLESFPVVNPRRDDSVGKIDKIILLTTCLLVIIIIIICTYSRHTLAWEEVLTIIIRNYVLSLLLHGLVNGIFEKKITETSLLLERDKTAVYTTDNVVLICLKEKHFKCKLYWKYKYTV